MLKDKMIKRDEDSEENYIEFNKPENDEKVDFSKVKVKIGDMLAKLRPKKKEIPTEIKEDIDALADSEYDALIETEEIIKMQEDVKRHKREKVVSKVKWYGMIFIAVYVIFLVFGGIVTQFGIDKNGRTVPIKMSYSDIQRKERFDLLIDYYKEVRKLYEKSLTFDYQLAQDSSLSITLASKYNKLISDTDTIYVKVKAISVDYEFETLQQLLARWMERFELYLKNMNSALSTNDQVSANKALEDRENVYTIFKTLTSNFIGIGKDVKGIKTETLKSMSEWTPDNYIHNELKKGN